MREASTVASRSPRLPKVSPRPRHALIFSPTYTETDSPFPEVASAHSVPTRFRREARWHYNDSGLLAELWSGRC
jgi:hypothetical protein